MYKNHHFTSLPFDLPYSSVNNFEDNAKHNEHLEHDVEEISFVCKIGAI